jgi:hypothetical protein
VYRYDKDAVHILLTTTSPSPPSTATSSLTPWFKNLTENVIALLPDAFSTPPAEKGETTQVPIGTIRYVPKTNKLSRLAILGDWRKYGFGRILVEELERAAALAGREGKAEVKDGKVLIKCHSQVSSHGHFLDSETREEDEVGENENESRRVSETRANVRFMLSHSTRSWGTSRKASGLTRTEVCLMIPAPRA